MISNINQELAEQIDIHIGMFVRQCMDVVNYLAKDEMGAQLCCGRRRNVKRHVFSGAFIGILLVEGRARIQKTALDRGKTSFLYASQADETTVARYMKKLPAVGRTVDGPMKGCCICRSTAEARTSCISASTGTPLLRPCAATC